MNIQDALKETGRAHNLVGGSIYASLSHEGLLCWYYKEGNELYRTVALVVTLNEDWQPYHEVKEIRPKNSEEVWINNFGRCMVLGWKEGELWGYFSDGNKCTVLDEGSLAVHGKNGWERIHPKVEDDSVERIEIEGVEWDTGDCTYPYQKGTGFDWDELINMKPMKLILEIPKETP